MIIFTLKIDALNIIAKPDCVRTDSGNQPLLSSLGEVTKLLKKAKLMLVLMLTF